MTFMLLLSIAMAQSPTDNDSDSKDSTESSETESEQSNASETEASEKIEETVDSEAESTDSEAEIREAKEAIKEGASVEKKADISLYSDFCPSGIKIPEIPNINQKREYEKQWMQANLERYLDQSEYIIIGEIAGHRSLMANQGRDMMVDVIVHEWLRGQEGAVVSIHVPYNTPFIPGCPETVPPTVVDGYKMLFFIDKQKMVLEGNALFYLEASYAWRNKRPDVFLSPRTDRDWVATDPTIDYLMYELPNIRSAIDASNARRSFVAQAETESSTTRSGKPWWQFWK